MAIGREGVAAKLRRAGGAAEGSPSSVAQARFHQIGCQSAAKTATAASPSRLRTRWTPGGMWSETSPDAGGLNPAKQYGWSRSAFVSCQALASAAVTCCDGDRRAAQAPLGAVLTSDAPAHSAGLPRSERGPGQAKSADGQGEGRRTVRVTSLPHVQLRDEPADGGRSQRRSVRSVR